MGSNAWRPDEAVRAEFFELRLSDLESGAQRSLADYQSQFPGFETVIEAAFRLVADSDDASGERTCDASAEPEELGPSVPVDRLGPYVLLRELGRGGQGTVHLAEDTSMRRRVALKVLNSLASATDDTLKRFLREGHFASRLNHPAICTVHETGIINGVPYISMPFVEGESLSSRLEAVHRGNDDSILGKCAALGTPSPLQRGQTTTRDPSSRRDTVFGILEMFEKLARAFHAAHEAGVIHRDIKPGNIMVGPTGDPVILDFGVARSDEEDLHALTQTGDLIGTPAYMSPELLSGQSMQVDRRADVYSLGVVLFECLALRRPFQWPTREGLYRAILHDSPPDLRRLNPSISDDVRVICDTALEKDRDRRYQTALDLAEDLRRCRAFEPIHAKPITRWIRVKRWTQRNPGVAVSLVLVGVSLTGGLVLSRIEAARADAQALEAQENAITASRNLASWRRMADVRLLADLEREAEEDLWPAWPQKILELKAWLALARELLGRRESHEATLEELRAVALPYGDEERRAHEAAHPRADELRELQSNLLALNENIDRTKQRISALTDESELTRREELRLRRMESTLDEMLRHLPPLREKVEALDAEVRRRPWKFSDREDQYRHEVFTDLIDGLARLAGRSGALSDVTKRLETAQTLSERSLGSHRAGWDAAASRVAADPRFSGFQLRRQVGLVPLGPDPASGLEEFGLLEGTGELPVRDASTQRLMASEATGLVFALIPGGSFVMGSQSENPSKPNYDAGFHPSEGPIQEITLRPFFLSKFEMTQAQWERLTGSNPSFWIPPQTRDIPISAAHPVEQVTWEESQKYLPRIGLTLPTEAQWERACRAGTETPWWCGSSAQSIQDRRAGNVADTTVVGRTNWDWTRDVTDGYLASAPVGSFAPNGFGLHDVLGNVSEWCQDRLGVYSYPARGPDGERRDPLSRSQVYRGGSFYVPIASARAAYRCPGARTYRNSALGLRPARPHH